MTDILMIRGVISESRVYYSMKKDDMSVEYKEDDKGNNENLKSEIMNDGSSSTESRKDDGVKKTRKQRKEEKKAKKEEKRRLHPGPLRRSANLIKSETEGIKSLYRDMKDNSGKAKNKEYEDESFDNFGESENIKISHARGKFKIQVRPSLADYYEFMLRYELSSVSGIFSVLISISALVLTFIAIFSGANAGVIIICVLIVLLLMLVGPFSYFIKALRLSRLSSSADNTKEYCFSSKGFDISSKSGEYIAFLWDDVYSARELKKAFYIFLNPDDGMIITKKDIEASGRKSEQFSELLYKKCPEKINIRKFL